MSKETSCFLFCPSRLFCLNDFWVRTALFYIVLVRVYNQQFQGNILLMVFDFQGFILDVVWLLKLKILLGVRNTTYVFFLFFVKGTRTTIISYAAYAICNHSGRHRPGDSKWPLHPQFGGHDSPLKGSHFHHPKKDTLLWITWERTFPQLSIFQIVFPDQGWLDVQIQKISMTVWPGCMTIW